MMISVVGMLLMATVIAQGIHLARSTSRERQKELALHVADAGIDRAILKLRVLGPTYTGISAPESTSVGKVQYTVQNCTSVGVPVGACAEKGDVVIESQGQVGTLQPSKRRVRVVLAPEPNFQFAMFSVSDVQIKNNAVVKGDIWGNGNVAIRSGDTIYGDVTSAGGTVWLDFSDVLPRVDDSSQGGNVTSGGFNTLPNSDSHGGDGSQWGVWLAANNAHVARSVFARRDCPTTETPGGGKYAIGGSGLVDGNATAFGSIAATVTGTRTAGTCLQRLGNREMPQFHYDPTLYATVYGASNVHEYTSAAAFQTYVDNNCSSLQGIHLVQEGAVGTYTMNSVDLKDCTITGTFIFATNTLINAGVGNGGGNVTIQAPGTAVVNIITTNPCPYGTSPNCGGADAVNLANNFQIQTTTPGTDPVVLLYAGCVAGASPCLSGNIRIKNNFVSTGAIYAGDIVNQDPGNTTNNLTITYDSRVQRTLGFGASAFTQRSWQEIPPQ